MSIIDKIQEKLEKSLYVGDSEAVYEQMWDDIESLLILFRAKNRAIEEKLKETEEKIKFITASDSVFRGSMSANKELNRLRGVKKALKELLCLT